MGHKAIILAALLLAGCTQSGASEPGSGSTGASSDKFPVPGMYHVIVDSGNDVSHRDESDRRVDAGDRESFERMIVGSGGANCRDRKVEIGGGKFSASMTCDAPDGDIHDVGLEAHGTYSHNSIEMTSDTILWGMRMHETRSYSLKS